MGKKSVFLTGAGGFIGRNITEQLGKKYDITGPSHSALELTDAAAVEKFIKSNDFDIVIHAANTGGTRKTVQMQNVVEANLKSFFNIARCASRFGKLVQIGSGAEYDKTRQLVSVGEGEFDRIVPSDQYGFYKYVCARHIQKSENMVDLRVFGCYGKYEDYEIRFISNSICRKLFGLPVKISNRNVVFSYLHVDDLVKVIDHFASSHDAGLEEKFYNVTPDEKNDLVGIGRAINTVAGGSQQIEVANPGLGNEYSGDNTRLKSLMKGLKFKSMEQGIKELHGWYLQNRGQIEKSRVSKDW
ncbi:NAD-dependent epimerase/dehydratase family protein [Candidatus Parvarchaeota archaeon]|nr:NAD-dependent epimerase/dehydratase family protein [Candidatus Parvarchaeota archaeon]